MTCNLHQSKLAQGEDVVAGVRTPEDISTLKEKMPHVYEEFVQKVRDLDINVGTGKFGAHMMVDLTNDGPVTILLESKREF